MQQAVIYSRAKQGNKETGAAKSPATEEDHQVNLAIERAKYKSFWVGVNRGISIDSKNPRHVEVLGKERKAAIERGRSKNIINPHGKYKLTWDGLISVLIIYSIIVIPVRIAFEPLITPPFVYLEGAILVFFGIDIIVNFNTAYTDTETDCEVHNRRAIAIHYLKFWFWVDLVSTFPFDLMVQAFTASGNIRAIRLVRALRLFRIFKLGRVSKFNETLQNLRINPQIVALVVLILCIFFIAHVFACGWHFIAVYKQNAGGTHTWLTVLGYEDDTIYDRYVACLYYVMVTMMTIGYGDIHPVTDDERLFAIATMLTGGVVFGAMISRLASILEKRNPEDKALRQNMMELKSYLVDVSLPKEMRKRVVDAYGYYLQKKSVYGEPSFYDQLPQPILYRLVRQLNEDDIRKVTLFHTYEMDFIVPLLLALKPFQANSGDVIFDEGDICNNIVFLKKGKIAISSSNGYTNVLAGYVRAGGYFGDMEYLRNTTCIATYSASKHSHLLAVSHQTINHAAAKCLDAGVRFRKQNQARYELFNQVLKQNKKGLDMNNSQQTLDDARALVNRLLSKKTPTTSPKQQRKSATAEKVPKKQRKSKTGSSQHVQSLWIDGVLVGTRNLHLLARHTEQPLPLDLDENLLRVIYVNEYSQIGPGEVPARYLRNHFIINPTNTYKLMWDAIIFVMVLYSVIIIPMEIGFFRPVYAGSETVATVTNGFFMMDILICFRTAYFEDDGDHLVIVPYMVAYQYCKTWLLVDLLGSLPFDYMFASFHTTSLTFTNLLKVIRVFRLLKLMRLMKVGYIGEEIEDRLGLSPAAMNLALMMLQVFFVGHIVACVLFGVSASITDHPWFTRDVPGSYGPQQNESLASQYILSLYWTFTIMSTVGYGDIVPGTTEERILNIFVILLGASMFGYMIANVSALLQSLNSTDAVKDEKIAVITEYLDEKQCPRKLQDAVIKHFRNYYKDASPYDVDKMMSRLPPKLACEIMLLHHDDTLKHIAVLQYIDNVSVRLHIFNLMKPVYYEPNEYMLKQGAPGNEILFLVEGRAVAFKKKDNPKKKVEKQASSFGSSLRPGRLVRRASEYMSSMVRSGSSKNDEKGSGKQKEEEKESPKQDQYASTPRSSRKAEDEGSPVLMKPSADSPITLDIAEDEIFARRNNAMDSVHLNEIFADIEPMLQSPPPPLPSHLDKFNFSLQVLTKGWNEDSGSECDEEYEALRKAQSPTYADTAAAAAPVDELASPKRGAFSFADWETSFKDSQQNLYEYESSDEEDSDEDDNRSHIKNDPTFMWTAHNMARKGMTMVGDISPGDFVGHLSLMHDTTNQVSVVTSAFSTVYILNKQDIAPMLSKQPTVSIQLQMALSRAISTQADVLGKFHMRQTRSKFLVRTKEDFYHKIDVLPREVKQIRKAQKNRMKQFASQIKQKIVRPRRSLPRRNSSIRLNKRGSTQLNVDMMQSVDDTDDALLDEPQNSTTIGEGVSRMMENFHMPSMHSPSLRQAVFRPVENSPQASTAPGPHVMTRRKTRKVRRVESLLNKYTELYESDDNKEDQTLLGLGRESSYTLQKKDGKTGSQRKQRLHASRTPLPARFALRVTSVRVEKGPPMIKLRKSFIVRSESAFSERFLFPKAVVDVAAKKPMHRVVSLNDLETLEPVAPIWSNSAARSASSYNLVADAALDELHSKIVPIWTNSRALRHENEILARRQSFPSLENDLWKVCATSQGLL